MKLLVIVSILLSFVSCSKIKAEIRKTHPTKHLTCFSGGVQIYKGQTLGGIEYTSTGIVFTGADEKLRKIRADCIVEDE